MKGYFRILMAIPGFFLSSLFVMLFSRSIAPQMGLEPVDYVFAMLLTSMVITSTVVDISSVAAAI